MPTLTLLRSPASVASPGVDFRAALPAGAARLRAYLDATSGGVMDEPATAKALAAAMVRGVDFGAVSADEASRTTGSDFAQLTRLAHTGQP
jgi:hypothetical protein